MKTFKEFEELVKTTAKGHDANDKLPTYAALGLAGETGEFVEAVKKAYRGDGPFDWIHAASELGDIVWYVCRAAQKLGIPLETIAQITEYKLLTRKRVGKNKVAERKEFERIIAEAKTLSDVPEDGTDGRTFGLV